MSTTEQRSSFELFMASGYGRLARVVLGLTVITAGRALIGGTTGWLIAAFGLAPIASGALGLCPVAPLWGGHFLGSKYCARDGRK